METIAKSKYIRTSPRKLRLVSRAIGGLSVTQALVALGNLDKRASLPILKTLKSAVANATHNAGQKEEELKIKAIKIDGGAIYKRIQPVSRGQAHSIQKRTSHITVILEGGMGELREKREKGIGEAKSPNSPDSLNPPSSLK